MAGGGRPDGRRSAAPTRDSGRELHGETGDRSERLRVPPAGGTLVVTPGLPDEDVIPSLLTAFDVLGTDGAGDQVNGAQRAGHLPARARPGRSAAVL